MATTYQLLNVTSEEKTKKSKTKTNIHARKKMIQLTDCAIIIRRGGGEWEMGEIYPKTKSYPPLIKQKLISTPALEQRYPPIDSLIPSLLFGFLPPLQT